jgi:hypothetical protein
VPDVGPSSDILADVEFFLALLERCCPKLLSKRRPQRAKTEWWSLLEPPARSLQRLQQRVAQLLEQQLWSILEQPSLQATVEQATVSLLTKARVARRQKKRTEKLNDLVTRAPQHLVDSHVDCVEEIRSCKSATWESQQLSTIYDADGCDTSSRDGSFDSEPWPCIVKDLGLSISQQWRKAFGNAKSKHPSNVREEAALWRRFGLTVQQGISDRGLSADAIAPLRGQICVTCEAGTQKDNAECYCLALTADLHSTPSSEPATSSASSEFDEAAKLLNECFQFVGGDTRTCTGESQDAPPVRPWRPINPCVGASSDWRRCENMYWRLFWSARARRVSEETEGKWPNTPSSMDFESEIRNLPDLDIGYGNMLWNSVPFPQSPAHTSSCKICHNSTGVTNQSQCLSPSADLCESLSVALQELSARNVDLEHQLAHFEHQMQSGQQCQESCKDSDAKLKDRAEFLMQRNAHLEQELAKRDASIQSLDERVKYLEAMCRAGVSPAA